jgi:hypothetical protein
MLYETFLIDPYVTMAMKNAQCLGYYGIEFLGSEAIENGLWAKRFAQKSVLVLRS